MGRSSYVGRTKRRRYGKKTFRKKRRAKRRRANTTLLMRGPVAKRTIAKLKYSEVVTMGPTTAGVSTNVKYLANGMYDPTVAVGGHQPMGFDELMSHYDHFTVIGSKITATAYSANGTPTQLSIYLAPGTTVITPATPSRLRETQRVAWRTINSTTDGPKTTRVTQRFSAKKFFSAKSIVGESSYKGNAATDPSETAVYQVIYGALDEASVAPAIQVTIQMEFIAVFTEPKALGQS